MDSDVDRGSFGPVLRRLRLEAQISQEELAERARLSAESISALERGRRRAPYRETIRMLADALRLSDAQRDELQAAAKRAKQLGGTALKYDSIDESVALSGVVHYAVAGKDDARKNNLPSHLTPLIGRAPDIAAIRDTFAATRLVTITGAGGIGKTRVALQVAQELFVSSDLETWFVDLAPLQSATLVATTIASTIGIRQIAGLSATESIIQYVNSQHPAIIVDNCEHVIEAAGPIIDSLLQSCPDLRVLATSREALNVPGEMVFRLPSLTVPSNPDNTSPETALTFSAIALFAERAKAADSSFVVSKSTAPSIADICCRLDGIPLAIELAAARTSVLSVGDLRHRLDDRLKLLTGGKRTALPRQQTMRALIDWSYDLLSEDEKTVFRRLSVFSGGWSLEAAQAVCSCTTIAQDDVADALFSLIGKSLVRTDLRETRSRYSLLESTRMYALEKLAAHGERQDVLNRHAEWLADFADSADELTWIWLTDKWQNHVAYELDNARVALGTTLAATGNARLAGRIAGGFANLWFEGGLQAEGRRWIAAALDIVDEDREPLISGRLWKALALLSSGLRIVTACEKAIALFSRGPNAKDLADAYAQLAFGLWQVGRMTEAENAVVRAIRLGTEFHFQLTRQAADILDLQASIFVAQGMFDDARRVFNESLELSRAFEDDRGVARTKGNLAELEFASGNAHKALALVDEAASTFERLGATSRLATARVNSAAYRLVLGDIDGARTDAIDALKLARRAQDTPLISIATQELATVLALTGREKNAAILIGYVDCWYKAEGYERERNEQKIYTILMASLAKLGDTDLKTLMRHGAGLTETEIAEAAIRFMY